MTTPPGSIEPLAQTFTDPVTGALLGGITRQGVALLSGLTSTGPVTAPAMTVGGSAVSGQDPLHLGFCTTLADSALTASGVAIVVAGYTQFYRILAGGYPVSHLSVFVNASAAGNIQLGYYANASGAPGAQLAASALTAVGTAAAVQTLSLGATFTPQAGEFLAIFCSTASANFLGFPNGNASATGSSNRLFQNTSVAGQLPAPAVATVAGFGHIHVWGS